MKKGLKIFLIVLALILIAVAGFICYNKFIKKVEPSDIVENEEPTIPEPEVIKELQIYKGTDRPIAITIDNEKPAWPHSGLQDAYMIYEMIIEGGETRMLALFKGKNTEKIGPIRSARHYFVHYAMEHGAIFTHFGWSPKAETTIASNKVNNINGIYDTFFWRVGYGYHNAFSSIQKIKTFAKNKNYLTTSSTEPKYKYNVDEVILENGLEVNNIKIKYSELHNVSYVYNVDKQVYYRSMRGIADKDRETGEQYFAKNIVIMYVNNYNLPDKETKGRQELENIGTGTGYYITNGKYINITWKKDSATSRTLWLDESGQEIVLNDGITYVQIAPKAYTVNLE